MRKLELKQIRDNDKTELNFVYRLILTGAFQKEQASKFCFDSTASHPYVVTRTHSPLAPPLSAYTTETSKGKYAHLVLLWSQFCFLKF